jgi:CO/xanthine dehydrogenase Mo-binding subunit
MLHIHTGVGNLGTFSHSGTSRVAAEVLQCAWENCVVERGDSRKHLPWNLGQFGSNTSFTMTRTNYVAAMDALTKLKEIAALDLGGTAEDYDIADETVFLKSDPTQSLTYAAAAQRAIDLGGKFSGYEVSADLNNMTKTSVAALAGTGLIGAAKDNLERVGTVPALAVGFMRIELDLETGRFEILEYLGVADCGTVIHPMGLATQIKGAAVMGIGMASSERHIIDPQNGLPANVGLYQAKPPTYLDAPAMMDWAAVDEPDPQNPVGAKGIGEPIMGCATAALLCAISDALGGHIFNRTPVVPDMIVNAVAGREQSHKPLQIHTA